MKRTFRIEAHLVELKREIPEMQVSQEEKLSGGFLGISGPSSKESVNNNNYYEGCHCNVNCFGCSCSSPTATATATATRTVIITLPF